MTRLWIENWAIFNLFKNFVFFKVKRLEEGDDLIADNWELYFFDLAPYEVQQSAI